MHLYAGEEASGVGVCMHLDDRDRIASTHRGHGHCIAKGCDMDGMMAEIYGRRDGLCGGKGGSMHIADLDKGMMGANGIVGGGPPLICGAGLAAKQLRTGGVAIAFVGDGGFNQGTTFESLNLASVWNLPCVFVVENNGYAESTGSKWSIACDDAADRASGFNMPGVVIDGHDFFAVHEVAGEAIKRAREGRRSEPAGMQAQPLLRTLRGRCADLSRPGRGEEAARDAGLPGDVPREGDRGRPAR